MSQGAPLPQIPFPPSSSPELCGLIGLLQRERPRGTFPFLQAEEVEAAAAGEVAGEERCEQGMKAVVLLPLLLASSSWDSGTHSLWTWRFCLTGMANSY